MNVIVNNCKPTIKIAINLLKNGNPSRGYATTIADYKIVWVKPKKETKVTKLLADKSGDQGLEIDIKPSDFCNKFGESPELKDANDIVKKLFTLQFLPRKEKALIKKERIMELVKRHELDHKSPEARIAALTSRIHNLQEIIVQYPQNSEVRVRLKEAIEKRRKYLRCLRKEDYRRFEWVLEKLNLIYKPLPEPPLHITRKDSLRRLTEKHCNTLVEDKLCKYKSELKELQKEFYKEKAEKLAFIRKEELACNLEPSVSEEDVICAQQKAEKYQM